MGVIFRKQAQKYWKRAKYLKIWAKFYKIWIYFQKSRWLYAIIECNELSELVLTNLFDGDTSIVYLVDERKGT